MVGVVVVVAMFAGDAVAVLVVVDDGGEDDGGGWLLWEECRGNVDPDVADVVVAAAAADCDDAD